MEGSRLAPDLKMLTTTLQRPSFFCSKCSLSSDVLRPVGKKISLSFSFSVVINKPKGNESFHGLYLIFHV
jgi:hypothetical protein